MAEQKLAHENGCRFDLRTDFFRNLQKLYLYHIDEEADRFLVEASQLNQLKVLMIENSEIQLKTLSLAKLEKLALKYNGFESLQLDTPNLSCLILWQGRQSQSVDLLFPLKLKYLECKEFDSSLSQLKSLQTLVCKEVTHDFRLADFKSLKRMEVWSFDGFQMVEKQKRELNRNNLEIFASGFKEDVVLAEPAATREDYFFSSFQLTPSYLAKIETNLSGLVGSIPWKFNITFSSFVRHVARIQSPQKDFLDKFRIYSILSPPREERTLLAENQIDQSKLIELLKRSSPSCLCLGFNVTPDFTDRLTSIQSIKEVRDFGGLKDLNFLLHLKNLEVIYSYFESISIDLLCTMVSELKFFSTCILKKYSKREQLIFSIDTIKLFEQEEGEEGPYFIRYSYEDLNNFNHNLKVAKNCESLNKLIQELRRMSEVEQIKHIFT